MVSLKKCIIIILMLCSVNFALTEEILMITMGGTKSHKIPFWELAKGLIARGHRVTFLNGFTPDFHIDGLVEVTPHRLVNYIQNYMNWDLVGARYAGKSPITLWQALRYPAEACNSLLSDPATAELLTHKFHLAIVDGAFPECALGLVHRLGNNSSSGIGEGGGSIPFVYINTVAMYTGSLAIAGNPITYAVTPHVFTSLTQSMDFLQRVQNCVMHLLAESLHKYYTGQVHAVLQTKLDPMIPHPYMLAPNVSFILQNGYALLTYPRPLQPNVAEIACIHCRPAVRLSDDLEQFFAAAPAGVIFFSMGSSVRASNMPEEFRRLLVAVFARLSQYHVLWKWEDGGNGNASQMSDVSANVRLSAWLPQQDVLGHRHLKAFVTHGGLLSMYEAIYHAVPMVMLPVFCDHDANAAKAAADGLAVRVPLEEITAKRLYKALIKVMRSGNGYRRVISKKRALLLDQMSTPLEKAVFWTEYVLRHKGAPHLQAPGRHMKCVLSFFMYHSLDVLLLICGILLIILVILQKITKLVLKCIIILRWSCKNKKD